MSNYFIENISICVENNHKTENKNREYAKETTTQSKGRKQPKVTIFNVYSNELRYSDFKFKTTYTIIPIDRVIYGDDMYDVFL